METKMLLPGGVLRATLNTMDEDVLFYKGYSKDAYLTSPNDMQGFVNDTKDLLNVINTLPWRDAQLLEAMKQSYARLCVFESFKHYNWKDSWDDSSLTNKDDCYNNVTSTAISERKNTEVQLEPQLQPKPEPKSEPESDLEPESESESESQSELEAKFQPELQSNLEPEMKPELQTELETELKPELQPESELELELELELESKPKLLEEKLELKTESSITAEFRNKILGPKCEEEMFKIYTTLQNLYFKTAQNSSYVPDREAERALRTVEDLIKISPVYESCFKIQENVELEKLQNSEESEMYVESEKSQNSEELEMYLKLKREFQNIEKTKYVTNTFSKYDSELYMDGIDDFDLLNELARSNRQLREFIRRRVKNGHFNIFLHSVKSAKRMLYKIEKVYYTESSIKKESSKETEQQSVEQKPANSNASRSILKNPINSQSGPKPVSMFNNIHFVPSFLTPEPADSSEKEQNAEISQTLQNIRETESPIFRHDDINVSETLCQLSKGMQMSSSEIEDSRQRRVNAEDIVRHTMTDHCYHQLRPVEEQEELIESDDEEEEEIDVVSYEKQTAHLNFAQLQRNAIQRATLIANVDKTSTIRRPRGRPPGSNSIKRKKDAATNREAFAPKRGRTQNNQQHKQRNYFQYNRNEQFDEIDKRQLHNTMERQRRVGLRNLFDDLKASMLIDRSQKVSKQTVLNKATKYISILNEKKKLADRGQKLNERFESLIHVIKKLRNARKPILSHGKK